MLPCALEVEERWLRQEIGQLQQLLRTDNLTCSKRHCEFNKVIQSRLRAFDHDESLHAALLQGPPLKWANSAGLYSINPRKAILAATRVVFKDAVRGGGIDHSFSMHGIVSLDQLEKHRLVLVSTVRREMAAAMMDMAQLSLLHELHNAATLHYGLFHMGFRAAILIHGLDPRLQTPEEQIMAKLNALFPPIAAAKLDSAAPLAPYSDGLRESIRFSVYEHLMRGNATDMTEWRALQTRLYSWCNMPGYAEARGALLRYTEEFKKIEVLCLSTLHSLESRRRSLYVPESPADTSFLTSSSRSSAAPSPCSSFIGSDKSADFEPGLQDSRHSFASGPSLSSASRHAAQNAPLLRGMPGREISAAKTDGAAFAGDLDAPPILTYPHDLSRHEFDQHPLARHLEMSPREKMQLGLIIPRQLSKDDVEEEPVEIPKLVKDKGKRRRFGRKGSDTQVPPVPPLPSIPEALYSNHTPGNFGRFVRRMRSKSGLATRDASSLDTAAPSASAAAELSKTPRKLKKPLRRSARSVISSPELQPSHDAPPLFDLASSDLTYLVPSQSAPASRRQSIVSPCETPHPRSEDVEDGPVLWRVAPPRLSPMEFARIRLIQAALERRDNDLISSGLTKLWFWTPRWETFLVLPCKQTSSTITPAQPDMHEKTSVPNLGMSSELDSMPVPDGLVQAGPDRRSFLSCPRLSLNLGNIALQLPSMLNLMTLDGIHPLRSLSSSTRSGSPPEAEDTGCAARRFSVYAERTEPVSISNTFTLDSQTQRTDQGFFPLPAGNGINRFSRQDVSTHTTRQIATQHPFQDTAIYNRSATPEAGPWGLRGHTSAAGSCNGRDGSNVTVPTRTGLTRPPRSMAVATRLHQHLDYQHQHVVGGEIVTPVAARKVGKLVAGASVVSMHAAHSEDFARPDVADEERALRPPPLHVVRQRPHAAGGRGLRERDTTRRNLFRSSNDDNDNDLRGLLRHLGDARETRPAPWSPLRYPGGGGGSSSSDSQPVTPETRRQSSVLSHLSITPTALRLGLAMRGRDEESEEEHSGLSPRQRKVAATHQPVPDSPTLPVVGPQVKMRRSSRRASHGSL
ncbi:uncharacterized protein BBA_00739 [Beauveria bassiana ARSEF 2860]|uniref:Uncharacterized protein n=1 Tax=Beauveria bassiana (strain ARSEF 2860) TaxID=655819 RepID=J4WJ89_BEAB2|nr:uncharacterized protein BBA_00739 [Beauveria bassiana ARSEF 2860]EJP69870.1 hypothetical protein BBA_00739 [Beauveria bassiana ARSEF 2860]